MFYESYFVFLLPKKHNILHQNRLYLSALQRRFDRFGDHLGLRDERCGLFHCVVLPDSQNDRESILRTAMRVPRSGSFARRIQSTRLRRLYPSNAALTASGIISVFATSEVGFMIASSCPTRKMIARAFCEQPCACREAAVSRGVFNQRVFGGFTPPNSLL